MNVIAYSALLYGRDFLASAIRSVIDAIDTYHVLYSPIGSHGHHTDVPCPETRDELYAIAEQAAGSKLRWHDGIWAHEGYQRDSIHQYAPDADVIFALDADEIWSESLVKNALKSATHPSNMRGVWRWRVPIIHYWRSFNRAVLHDPAYPERIIIPRNHGRPTSTLAPFHDGIPDDADYRDMAKYIDPSAVINHMGYAQRSEIVKFKLETHGHKGEFRKDVDWYSEIFMANRQTDCHPVGSEYWNPEQVNPWDYLPEFMKSHPYANLEVIP